MRSLEVSNSNVFQISEKDIPKAEPGMVVIKVAYASICGSDYHIWNGGPYLGLVPGHEFSGVIADAGDSDFQNGDKVCAMEINPCGVCSYCLNGQPNLCPSQMNNSPGISCDGGYAEYVKVRSDMVRKIPSDCSLLLGAICEPLAVSYHGCRQADIQSGDKVLIWGAGPIGVYAAASAKALGASYVGIVEINPNRAALAETYSFIDDVYDFNDSSLDEKLRKVEPDGFKKIVETCGKQEAITRAADLIQSGGSLTLLGLKSLEITVSTMTFLSKEMHLLSGWFFTPSDYEQSLKILSEGTYDLEKTITSVIPFADVQKTFVDLTSGSTKQMKVVIDPSL